MCSNRKGRPLGCRVYFCSDETLHMQDVYNNALEKIKKVSLENNIPNFYAPLSETLMKAGMIIDLSSQMPHSPDDFLLKSDKILFQ
jgi:hypothetical protein